MISIPLLLMIDLVLIIIMLITFAQTVKIHNKLSTEKDIMTLKSLTFVNVIYIPPELKKQIKMYGIAVYTSGIVLTVFVLSGVLLIGLL